MKIIYFSETLAAYVLKVGKCIQVDNSMKLNEYQRSGSFLDFGRGAVVKWLERLGNGAESSRKA